MKLKHLKIFEELPTFSDPFYGNDVFKIRYRSLTNLSNKKAPDSIDKPTNDLLDQFQEGDLIIGMGVDDEKEHSGEVVSIKKDEKGENVEISIEEDGHIIKLAPGTVKFQPDGDKGNTKKVSTEPTETGMIDYTAHDTFQPNTYESKSIKKFSDFKSE
jgi:hypothetical protein